MTENSNRVDFLEDLITSVSKRPTMYTGSDTFYSAMAFVSGYVGACKDVHDRGEWDVLNAFEEWISTKLARPKNWVWVSAIYDFHGENDQLALDHVSKLFKEFRESTGPVGA